MPILSDLSLIFWVVGEGYAGFRCTHCSSGYQLVFGTCARCPSRENLWQAALSTAALMFLNIFIVGFLALLQLKTTVWLNVVAGISI